MISMTKKSTLLSVILLFTSCTQVVPHAGFQDVQTLVAERIDKKVQWNQNTEDDAKVSEAITKLLEVNLTLDSAVQVALLNNPEIQLTYEKLGIAKADLVQAGLLKNSIFDAEIHFRGSGIGTGSNLNIFQDFISVFQLPLKKRIAAVAFESTKLEVANSVLSLASEVKSAFLSLQGTEEMLNLRRHIVTGLQASAEIVKRQHKAGNISDLDIATEHQVYAKAKLELVQAEANVIQEREKLNLLMGLWGKQTKWSIIPRLPNLPKEEVVLEGLETLAVTNRLDLRAAEKEIEAVGRNLGLIETYRLIPDLTLGVDVEGEGKSEIVPGPNFQLPLPIFDQGQARVAGAEAILREAQKKYLALAVRIRSEVRMARNQMLASRARAQYAKETLIPVSQRAVQQTQLEYNGMLIGVFQLLTAKKEEIGAGTMYVESLRDYWLARGELEKAVGGSFLISKPAAAAHDDSKEKGR